MADGSIVFDTRIDNTQAAKDLQKLEKKIQETEKSIESLTSQKKAAQKESMFKAAELDQEKASLQEIKDRLQEIRSMSKDKTLDAGTREAYKEMIPGVKTELQEQQARVNALQREYNKVYDSVGRYDQKLQKANITLDNQKINAQMLTEQIQEANKPTAKFGQRVREAGENVETLENRIKRLASRVFVFSMITAALRSFRSWMGKVIKTNSEASAAMAKLKGALLTMVQPLVNIIIPAFVTFVNILTQIASVAAELMTKLFGGTVEQSADAAKGLYKETEALEATGDAAKDAGKSLASFDEINKLSGDTAGGGAKADQTIAPDFSGFDNGLAEKLKDIADLVFLIGTAFATWKLGSFLSDLADAIPALSGILGPLGTILQVAGGIAMAFGGIILSIDGITDAWENGVDWGNMAEMIGGVALAAIGFYIALSKIAPAFAPIAAGITLVVGGLSMLITGFHDAMESGWNLQNTLLSIAGLFATGLGISLITGSFIPALIGAIAGLILAITVATGHGEELIAGMEQFLQGFIDFFVGIFTGDIERAIGGLENIFSGLKTAIGAILDGIRDFFLAFLDWIDEKTNGKLHGIIDAAKKFVIDAFDSIKTGVGMFLDSVKEIFLGLIDFFTGIFALDFDKAWQGIVKIFDGICGKLLSPFVTIINLIIDALNVLIRGMNKISFDAPDWVPGIGGKTFGINIKEIPKVQPPRLATGAVIPPNREFMAVLGDQRHGNNIEAPEDLIRQIVREEGGGNNAAILRQILAAIKEGKVMMVDHTVFAQLVSSASDSEKFRRGDSMVTVH